jgi:hypothetical protein
MPSAQNNRLAYALFFLGVVVLIGVGVIVYPRYTQSDATPFQAVTTSIKVEHQYKNGIHTYVGEVQVPTPCHTIFGEAVVQESHPEQVALRLETKENQGACAQVISIKKFKVSFQASKDAVVHPYLNSTPVLFKTTEAPASVDLDAIEV